MIGPGTYVPGYILASLRDWFKMYATGSKCTRPVRNVRDWFELEDMDDCVYDFWDG